MQVGMTMPMMEPVLDTTILQAWASAIDEGPFSSVCFGERVAFGNPETFTLMGALTAWTSRVRLVATVVVPQLHDPVMLAKALATADMLSDGRLTVGIGVGGRQEDYRAVGADPATQTMRDMADRVAVMKRVWAGEKITESVCPVGPAPVQPGGPELLVGSLGPKTIRSAALWADGLAGMTLDLDTENVSSLFAVARAAWAEAGKPAPRLTSSFWFALGEPDTARQQMHRHLLHYMNWIPTEYVDAMAPTTGLAGSQDELRAALQTFADIGADEVQLIPTSTDVNQLRDAAEVVAGL
jgi:alkanesulfonate monooxygenase SsuD/methylene tetrahydromethanopterin reductase-like flavin-dependent oxidoreductase (luciferase family)